MEARFVEIKPGEWRVVCHGCGRILGHLDSRRRWCDTCKRTRGRYCDSCGKPSNSETCAECERRPPQVMSETLRPIIESMWAKGFTAADITKKLGIRTKYPGTAISKARRRGWDLPYRRPDNVEWGKRVAAKNHRVPAAERRRVMPGVMEIAERSRNKYRDDLRASVERMWADGFTAREIAENVGWNPEYGNAYITKCRKKGWTLPHRLGGGREQARKNIERANALKWSRPESNR